MVSLKIASVNVCPMAATWKPSSLPHRVEISIAALFGFCHRDVLSPEGAGSGRAGTEAAGGAQPAQSEPPPLLVGVHLRGQNPRPQMALGFSFITTSPSTWPPGNNQGGSIAE